MVEQKRDQENLKRLMMIHAARDIIALDNELNEEGPKLEKLADRMDEICRVMHHGESAVTYFDVLGHRPGAAPDVRIKAFRNSVAKLRQDVFDKIIGEKRHHYLKKDWERIIRAYLGTPDASLAARTEQLLRAIAARIASPHAQELAAHFKELGIPYELFGDGYLTLAPTWGEFRYPENFVKTRFDPPGLERTTPREAPMRLERNRRELHPILHDEIAAYIAANTGTPRMRGLPTLRTAIQSFEHLPGDAVQPLAIGDGTRMFLSMGSSDWHAIQAFNLRVHEDHGFRGRAMRERITVTDERGQTRAISWLAAAVPPFQGLTSAAVPSFCASHAVVVTGSRRYQIPEYITLTLRPKTVRFVPYTWSIGIEENHMGARMVGDGSDERDTRWINGDASLHDTAQRGIEEELGLMAGYGPGTFAETSPLLLLSLEIEADFASVVGVFETHAETLTPEDVVARMRHKAKDFHAEVQVVAFEPARLGNLVRLILSDSFDLRGAHRIDLDGGSQNPRWERRYYTQDASFDPNARGLGWHPTARGRLLRYIIANPDRYPREEVFAAFQEQGLMF